MRGAATRFLANSDPEAATEPLIGLTNSLPDGDSPLVPEWMEVPYAEVPISLDKVRGLQRLDRPIAERLVGLWNSWRGRLARRFAGVPVYLGHPDCQFFRNRGDTDDNAYGWVTEVQAADTGLRMRVEWSPAGAAVLANKSRKFFSPFFAGRVAGQSNGTTVYEPVMLQSVGLTNTPNWPVEPLVNATTGEMPTDGGMDMLGKELRKRLGLPETATDEECMAALDAVMTKGATVEEANAKVLETEALLATATAQVAELTNAKTTAETLVAALRTEKDSIQAELVNARAGAKAERESRLALVVDSAICDGRVLQANRDTTLQALCNSTALDADLDKLSKAPKAIKTTPISVNLGARDMTMRDRQQKAIDLANARMKDHGETYETAFAVITKDHPELFGKTK